MFRGRPEILVPPALELILRGAFEGGAGVSAGGPGRRRLPATASARRAAGDAKGVLSASGRPDRRISIPRLPSAPTGKWGRRRRVFAAGLGRLRTVTRTYRFEFTRSRQLADAERGRRQPPPVREVLCPGLMSQAAFLEGSLREAGSLADSALRTADRLGIAEQYFAFAATRTSALLALERRDLAASAGINESILGHQAIGRPFFDHFAQLDRALIWAMGGDLDQALSSLPAARAALRSQDPFIWPKPTNSTPVSTWPWETASVPPVWPNGSGRTPVRAKSADRPRRRGPSGGGKWPEGGPRGRTTIGSGLELRLLRAGSALAEESSHSARLVREALGLAHRYGYVQTVLETAPL